MDYKTVSAHFDGKQICFDEPVELKPKTKLLVTILSEENMEAHKEIWYRLAVSGLERAYGENEPEYSVGLVKEANPEYQP